MSLYQKYRAKTFAEIITQDHITKILQNSLKKKSFGHSYLFVGTRGAGKTSTARIFARALNCLNKKNLENTGEPCNECESCKSALLGNHPDIIEMDAASNRGIDEIRNLKESVEFMPSIGSHKVYIIDEVHMMTKEAFNALLKTLEEPPHHIIFLMATTELFKIPATIISRSQVFELKFASIDDILQKIQFILKGESREVDLEAQKLIAKLGKGSFRDTETILEKVLTSSESKGISLDEVTSILGLSQAVLITEVKDFIYSKDLVSLQKTLQENLDDGAIYNFNYQLADEVYSDIVKALEANKVESFNLELFNFLTSIDKDIRSTSNPKMLYVAKILNFVKNFRLQSPTIPFVIPENSQNLSGVQGVAKDSNHQPLDPVSSPSNTSTSTAREGFRTVRNDKDNASDLAKASLDKSAATLPLNDILDAIPAPVIAANNPMSLLRAKASADKKTAQKMSSSQNDAGASTDTKIDAKTIKSISKMDFLEYLKSKNMFLYRFFVHKEFEVQNGAIIVNAEKKLEQDLLKKTTTHKIISDFGTTLGIELSIKIGEPKIDHRKVEEKKIEEVSKKVEDLTEGEIKEIFNLK